MAVTSKVSDNSEFRWSGPEQFFSNQIISVQKLGCVKPCLSSTALNIPRGHQIKDFARFVHIIQLPVSILPIYTRVRQAVLHCWWMYGDIWQRQKSRLEAGLGILHSYSLARVLALVRTWLAAAPAPAWLQAQLWAWEQAWGCVAHRLWVLQRAIKKPPIPQPAWGSISWALRITEVTKSRSPTGSYTVWTNFSSITVLWRKYQSVCFRNIEDRRNKSLQIFYSFILGL